MRPSLMNPTLLTVGLLCLSNLFMTFAWYGHLRTMKDSPWWPYQANVMKRFEA